MRSVKLYLLHLLILPKSKNKDQARKEFITNIFLIGVIILSNIAFLVNLIDPLVYHTTIKSETPVVTGTALLFFSLLLFFSRKGHNFLTPVSLLTFLFILGIYGNYRWGPDLPELLLLFVLLIVMSGILISTKAAFFTTFLSICNTLLFAHLAITHRYSPYTNWKLEPVRMTDAVVYAITFAVIALVSWLSNREIEKSLKRAESSEKALQRQRDHLEILVEERTQELRRVQAEKLTQLYRFAEFGRITSGLFHDLVNHLSLLSLNLDRMNEKSKKMDEKEMQKMLSQSISSLRRLEKFVLAARKQIQNQQILESFSIKKEVNQAIEILAYKARKAQVHISFRKQKDIVIYNNPVKFSQMLTNLLSNAIDSYEGKTNMDKQIIVALKQLKGKVKISVQDWGSGIQKKHLPSIFNPLFTTKSFEKGTGMGLAICKEIVEKDFKGTISVKSREHVGTTFTIIFPIKTQEVI